METITIRDIAKMCGVGVSTVSRAINNHPDINPETKQMILQVIEESNYIPNNSARNLKRTDAKTIAVLVKGITNPFFSDMIRIMEEEIKRKKYSLVLHHVEFSEDEVEVGLQLIQEKRLRGIVFLGGHFSHTQEKLSRLSVPFVLSTVGAVPGAIDRRSYSSVSVDDEKESSRMVDYLCRLGHERIAILCARACDSSIGRLRFLGYKKALAANHIPFREELVLPMDEAYPDYSMENGYHVARKLLSSGTAFSALYAISDMLAIGAMKAFTDEGKRIPQDYSVAGFDGIPIGRFYNPSLTTLKQPVEDMAYETIRLLFDLIRKKTAHQQKVFAGELLLGESTEKPQAGTPASGILSC